MCARTCVCSELENDLGISALDHLSLIQTDLSVKYTHTDKQASCHERVAFTPHTLHHLTAGRGLGATE